MSCCYTVICYTANPVWVWVTSECATLQAAGVAVREHMTVFRCRWKYVHELRSLYREMNVCLFMTMTWRATVPRPSHAICENVKEHCTSWRGQGQSQTRCHVWSHTTQRLQGLRRYDDSLTATVYLMSMLLCSLPTVDDGGRLSGTQMESLCHRAVVLASTSSLSIAVTSVLVLRSLWPAQYVTCCRRHITHQSQQQWRTEGVRGG